MKNCASNRKHSQELAKQLESFDAPLLVRLDKRLDKRLERYREFSIPLYRLRSALSRLWMSHPPSFAFSWQSLG